ncbi:hypothetical protein M0802_003090 [Mischocyttarus mexicanus]|nr:hypothetical protein M0802_003090 [Mischocyttarus mexicanus]
MRIIDRKCLFLIASYFLFYFVAFLTFIPPSNGAEENAFCTVPSQPANGRRYLYKMQCQAQENNCSLQEGALLPIGSYLIYECNPGYKINGSNNLFCGPNGRWFSTIPICVEIHCKSLSSVSREITCLYNGQSRSCESPILPETAASIKCRNGYREDKTFLSEEKNRVTCNKNGVWEPRPVNCIPVCGIPVGDVLPLIAHGKATDITKVPWHASLYTLEPPNGRNINNICGATIIKENLLLTAAHCVFDEVNGKTANAEQYYVMAGNVYRQYDSPLHNLRYVQKSKVKKFYVRCNYLGAAGNYASDIALVEIETPFNFSAVLLPACVDQSIVESGNGLIAGFGETDIGSLSSTLQSTTVPYVSTTVCNSVSPPQSKKFLPKDKFCAGFANESSIRRGDSGGGLVFQTNGLWYLRGIASVALCATLDKCNKYIPFTRISDHLSWLEDTIIRIETSKSLPSCGDSSITSTATTITTPTPTPFIPSTTSIATTTSSLWIPKPIVCKAPPQPANGNRQLHKFQCQTQENCDVQEGVELPGGSHLVYTCNHGYEIRNGTRDVLCGTERKWFNIPVCVEIRCESLVSKSTFADCTYNDEWIPCESAVLPGTIATLSCRNSYKEDSPILSKRRNQVRCNQRGQWTPDPIQCIAVCGFVQTFNSRPFIVEGNDGEFFPWHATLYERKHPNGIKTFICGATIIKENFLITAAHCVYDETISRVNNPERYYIATGNVIRDYDYQKHDLRFVKKARVKKIYVNCNYLGLLGNYAWDIAILEIEKPFVFTRWLLPACINDNFIESGLGVVAGFGVTASGLTSPKLKFTKLPYVPNNLCKTASTSIVYEQLITYDKLCAGYTNGTSVCEGDSGGGLIFENKNLWYLGGIVSTGISVKTVAGTTACDSNSYSLYTRISSHYNWIQNIIYNLESGEILCIK